jgi:hypothetical protein
MTLLSELVIIPLWPPSSSPPAHCLSLWSPVCGFAADQSTHLAGNAANYDCGRPGHLGRDALAAAGLVGLDVGVDRAPAFRFPGFGDLPLMAADVMYTAIAAGIWAANRPA